jgi:hypothetical protein
MDPMTIGSILGGLCCCSSVAIAIGGGAFWFLKRNKGDGAASAAGALDAVSSFASSAAAAGQEAVKTGQQAVADASTPTPDPHADKRARLAKHIGEEQAAGITGLEHVKIADETGMTLVKQSGDAYLMEDPDDGDRMWMWRPADGGAEIPAEQWTDFWGPLPPGDIAAFCDHWVDQQDAEHMHTDTLEDELAKLGYPDVGSWHRVYWTAVKHFGRSPGPGADLSDYDTSDLMMKHMMPARMRQQNRKAQQNAASDSELLAPFEGVTVETYAACAAAAAQGMSQDQFTALLAQHDMDVVKWERVNAEWSDRMSKDATMTIVQIYGNAFQAAGQGQFGAAGAQASAARQGEGGAAGGGEPVPFDRLCEIQGAMSAWSSTGQDVNAMLKEVFGITAMDWSNMSSWWMSRMATDWEKMQEYTERCDQFEIQYKEAAGVTEEDPDADIQF